MIAERLREQAGWCRRLGSPLYTSLLEDAARDVENAGPCWAALQLHESDPAVSVLALRFLGAVHRLVLLGRAPNLARFYPSAGGVADPVAAWPAFRDAVHEHIDFIREWLPHPVQTNEVSRSIALLGGFLLIARQTGLPLRLLEIGSSAGLNLRWDHYYYAAGELGWGDPLSPVHLNATFEDGAPPLDLAVRVTERAGCDTNPVDPASPEGALTLGSYVWPDQTSRLDLLRAAIEVARRVPVPIDQASAIEWLSERLHSRVPGTVIVVFHSMVTPYIAPFDRERLPQIIAEAGLGASAAAPLAWLRMEPGESGAEVRLTLWPSAEDRLIATAGYHGHPVRWLIPCGIRA